MNWRFWRRHEQSAGSVPTVPPPVPPPNYHLQFISERPSEDEFHNPTTIIRWRCSASKKEFERIDYGRNRYNTCLEFNCDSCGHRLPGHEMQQDQWGHDKEFVKATMGVQNLDDGLTEVDKSELRAGRCPDCHGTEFYEGPSGGMATNWQCATEKCGSRFNIAGTFFMQRISEPSPNKPKEVPE